MNTLTIEIQARRRRCCCCDSTLYLPVHPGGQSLVTDDVVDRALWSYGWGKWKGEVYCADCLSEKPHVRMAMVDDRRDGMSIRVVASNDWRKR